VSYVRRKSRKPEYAKRSEVSKSPSGTSRPRSATRRISAGGAVPSRCTWSSALGITGRGELRRRARECQPRLGWVGGGPGCAGRSQRSAPPSCPDPVYRGLARTVRGFPTLSCLGVDRRPLSRTVHDLAPAEAHRGHPTQPNRGPAPRRTHRSTSRTGRGAAAARSAAAARPAVASSRASTTASGRSS
jgi:hypothetical protein